jgi:trehalose-phosphatase
MTEPSGASDDPGAVAEELLRASTTRPLALFLDYDGTLTPIVARPEAAFLPATTRGHLEALVGRTALALVSGRSLDDLRERASVTGAILAGSHGYEIEGDAIPPAPVADPAIAQRVARAAALLEQHLAGIEGALVEPKRFAATAHWRLVAPDRVAEVEAVVDAVAAKLGGLRKTHGKMVFELRPELAWHKGRAVTWILRHLGGPVLPVYVGDDVTDLDGLDAVREEGIGIAVGDTLPATAARFRLASPNEVSLVLGRLATELPGPPREPR